MGSSGHGRNEKGGSRVTRLFDDASAFTEQMLDGFLDVHASRVVGVPGGVVRATAPASPKVGVVVGGGSGHYPAFCGVVGPGFADGAVVGNIFTSPSTADALSVARAASSGAGVLFSFGNYAGDVMNFGLAEQRLNDEGIPTRTVLVTDDIASAPREEAARRRGIAGDFVVFKVAGAAAEEGYDLDGVERVARRANDRTRTLGVAFDGCTIPGQAEPLFSVPAGRMAVGLGIHGEPGIAEVRLPTAAELAGRLVDALLQERPADTGPRVAAILNGLGTTKYEELFVVWRSVARLLEEAGLTVVEPEVGELVTSLDMAGCSLTLVFLDEELEGLWRAPADTPAYRKGGLVEQSGERRAGSRVAAGDTAATEQVGSDASNAAAGVALLALERAAALLEAREDELARLDSVAGDGDHGRGMLRGATAALERARSLVERGAGTAWVLAGAGDAWGASAGGTSGVLWGAALAAFGQALGNEKAVDGAAVAVAARRALEAVQQLGGAQVGDKTMVDAMVPFVERLEESVDGARLADGWAAAATAAQEAAARTAGLTPRLGRARPLAERSVGTPDPGATSFALIVEEIAAVLADAAGKEQSHG